MTSLDATIARVRPLDASAVRAARARQDQLAKPAGSLGSLERLYIQLAGIGGAPLPSVERPCIAIMAADHGVADEGVSAYPRQVTAEMVRNFARGGAAINVLAREAGARIVVADFGIDWPPADRPTAVVDCSIARGTENFARGLAMSRALALASIEAGIRLAERCIAEGADLLALGEMGIGNTTSAAAIIAAMTDRPAEAVTGFGTGVDGSGWRRKVGVVELALRRLASTRAGRGASDPLTVLSHVGGFEIGGLAGAMLGAAAFRRPVVVDGVIVAAGALLAVALCPEVRSYLIASHRSAEPGHRIALEFLELEPLMDLGLRLGEGSSAALALGLIRAACRLPREMATFTEAGVSGRDEARDDILDSARPTAPTASASRQGAIDAHARARGRAPSE